MLFCFVLSRIGPAWFHDNSISCAGKDASRAVRLEPGKASCRFHGGLSTGPARPKAKHESPRLSVGAGRSAAGKGKATEARRARSVRAGRRQTFIGGEQLTLGARSIPRLPDLPAGSGRGSLAPGADAHRRWGSFIHVMPRPLAGRSAAYAGDGNGHPTWCDAGPRRFGCESFGLVKHYKAKEICLGRSLWGESRVKYLPCPHVGEFHGQA